ncbi:DgyrCDS9850 [Dimorphilus gyrociliatus]|uniref:DgyrCDS9850 n=1 Tax=Dimorphilus gyrociliatus TaxID=2664684 RepID=A0A7I8VZI5_9ANNE|nr:DgyrCDS9850 [Dimorphilus gyrociliatus]
MAAPKDTVSLISESNTPNGNGSVGARRPSLWPSAGKALELAPHEKRKPSIARKESLIIPGKIEDRPSNGRDSPNRRPSISSRRESNRSNDSRVSAIDFSKLETTGHKKDDEEKGKTITNTDSYIRTAIPYLPQSLAILCLILNILLPGSGTILSGLCLFCCGKSRLASKDNDIMTVLCVNICIGISQLFTVTFLLVGWFWSLTWGIYMVILAGKFNYFTSKEAEVMFKE